jgi:hypothetical protein
MDLRLWRKAVQHTDWLDKRFVPCKSLVSRKIADDMILVPIRKTASEVDCIYRLNDIGEHIWSLMNGDRSLKQIADLLTQEYDVDIMEAQKDVVEFVEALSGIGALEEAENGVSNHAR